MGKTIVLALLAGILFNNCLTVSRIEKNCDKFQRICQTGETIIYRDSLVHVNDTILVTLPQDTVIIRDTVIIKDGLCYVPYRLTERGIISVLSGVEGSIMMVDAWINDSSMLYPISYYQPVHTITNIKYITETIETTPKWYRPLWIYFVITVVLALLYVIVKLLKIKSL